MKNTDKDDILDVGLDLLFLKILLEKAEAGHEITLFSFLNKEGTFDDWADIHQVRFANRPTDASSLASLFIKMVIQTIKDFDIGIVKAIHVETGYIAENVLSKVIKIAESDRIKAEQMLSEAANAIYCGIDFENAKEIPGEIEHSSLENGTHVVRFPVKDNCEFKVSDELNCIASTYSHCVKFEVEFDKKKLKNARNILSEYLERSKNYIYSEETESLGLYSYPKEVENFLTYIKSLSKIGRVINIPTASLKRRDFNIVKILAILEGEGKVHVFDWASSEFWSVGFNFPIERKFLLGDPIREMGQDRHTIKYDSTNGIVIINGESVYTFNEENGKVFFETLYNKIDNVVSYEEIASSLRTERSINAKLSKEACHQWKSDLIKLIPKLKPYIKTIKGRGYQLLSSLPIGR